MNMSTNALLLGVALSFTCNVTYTQNDNELICNKKEIKECFKAIQDGCLFTVKRLINDQAVPVNTTIDLNTEYLEEGDLYTFQGETQCSLLEWARYNNCSVIYFFLSKQKNVNFEPAGFLPLKAGSLIPLNEDGSYNKNEKNAYPINLNLRPRMRPTQITENNMHLVRTKSQSNRDVYSRMKISFESQNVNAQPTCALL